MKGRCLHSDALIFSLAVVVGVGGWGCLDRRYVDVAPERASVLFDGLQRDDDRPVSVDVLVVVDNSGSMAAEQEILARDFPILIREILDPSPSPDGKEFAAAADLHVGVVSTDVGVGGYSVQTCERDPMNGDNGILQHTPHGEGCDPSYPNFLSYPDPEGSPGDPGAIDRLAADFGCIARLGTDGCGFEQQLEAAYRALVVQSAPGGANAGFLRPDSIIVLFFISDEEDCSASDPSIFDPNSPSFCCGYACYYDLTKLFTVDRYAEMLRSLRSSDDDFAAGFVVGVPQYDSVCNGRGNIILNCLDLPQMQMIMDPEAGSGRPKFACRYPADCQSPDPPYPGDCVSLAFPARRFVELAQMLGASATVSSICAQDYVAAVTDLADLVKEKMLKSSHNAPPYFVKNEDDPTGCLCDLRCTIIEELTDGKACSEGKTPYDDGSGRTLCVIPQVGSVPAGCDCCLMDGPAACECAEECDAASAGFIAGTGAGWWYDPDAEGGPSVEFVGLVPEEGSTLHVTCL